MAGDVNYPSVSLLLACTGANNSTTFTDTSTTTKTATAVGNAKIVTTQTDPFGASNGVAYFDGTGDYVTLDDLSLWEFTSGDFTLEFFANASSGGVKYIIGKRGAVNGGWMIGYNPGTSVGFNFWSTGGTYNNTSGPAPTADAWVHVAVVRSGTTYTTYVAGVGGTPLTTANVPEATTEKLVIGREREGSTTNQYLGYISNIRITSSAIYTSNFTPPSTAFLPYAGQLTGSVTEGSYSYISKWMVKVWKSFSASVYKEQIVTGTTYSIDLPTLDPYVLACSPYIDGKWEANKVVTLGQFYTTSNPETSAHLWEVTTAGTFGATEATWNLSGTTTQGTAVLTYVGLLPNPSILGPKIPS